MSCELSFFHVCCHFSFQFLHCIFVNSFSKTITLNNLPLHCYLFILRVVFLRFSCYFSFHFSHYFSANSLSETLTVTHCTWAEFIIACHGGSPFSMLVLCLKGDCQVGGLVFSSCQSQLTHTAITTTIITTPSACIKLSWSVWYRDENERRKRGVGWTKTGITNENGTVSEWKRETEMLRGKWDNVGVLGTEKWQ